MTAALLLIGGHQRSGTTLLRDLCHGHPQVAVTRELGAMLALNRNYRRYRNRVVAGWRRKGFRNRILAPVSWLGPPTLRDDLAGHVFTARYLRRIRRYADGAVGAAVVTRALAELLPGNQIVGDKWNGYVFELDQLVTIDAVSIVIIYRDCRDVTSSFLHQARTTWRGEDWVQADQADAAEGVARRWLRAIDLMERHAGSIHMIRYESLVHEPKRVLTRLAAWLSVDPEGFHHGAVTDTSLGKYRQGLTPRELDQVIAVAGPAMARLGYR